MVIQEPEVLWSCTHSWFRLAVPPVSDPGVLYQISPTCSRAAACAGVATVRTTPNRTIPRTSSLRIRFPHYWCFCGSPIGIGLRPDKGTVRALMLGTGCYPERVSLMHFPRKAAFLRVIRAL